MFPMIQILLSLEIGCYNVLFKCCNAMLYKFTKPILFIFPEQLSFFKHVFLHSLATDFMKITPEIVKTEHLNRFVIETVCINEVQIAILRMSVVLRWYRVLYMVYGECIG